MKKKIAPVVMPEVDPLVKEAIQRQVDREDLERWGRDEVPVHRVIPPMPSTVWKQAPLHAFLSKIIP